jgi:hypothetical protein
MVSSLIPVALDRDIPFSLLSQEEAWARLPYFIGY